MFSSWKRIKVDPEAVCMMRTIKQLKIDVADGGAS
jgi:hypothetical protein